jgi:hypothetical protein
MRSKVVLSRFSARRELGLALCMMVLSSACTVTALRPHEIVKDGSVCGKHAPNEALVVNKNRGLANVVVAISGIKKSGTVSPGAGTLDQRGCRYVPHVQALTAPSTLTLVNSDAVFHNVNARLVGTRNDTPVFNVPTPFKGHRLKQNIKKPGVVNIRCDAGHTWMGAWVVAFDHPYYDVTNEEGRFSVNNVPDGTWELSFWHEPLPGEKGSGVTRVQKIEIVGGKARSIDFDFSL